MSNSGALGADAAGVTKSRRLASKLVDWLAPRSCIGCDGDAVEPLCSDCGARIVEAPERSIDGVPVLSCGRFDGPLQNAVHRFKYGGRPDLAKPLGALLAPLLTGYGTSAGFVLVPVPLHPKRLVERGYNQAALLARVLGKSVGAKALSLALARSKVTQSQARLARAERSQNVSDVFRVRGARALAGHSVVLVDDVVTTGATARDCIRALHEVGAEVALVVSIATAADRRFCPADATELL